MPLFDEQAEALSRFGFMLDPDDPSSLSSGLLTTFGHLDYETLPSGIIDDHAARTVALLIEQLRKNPRMSGLVTAVVSQLQEIEDTLFDLLRFRGIPTATGIQLDAIGAIIGLPRTSPLDTQYRSDIYFQIAVNNSQGTPESMIGVLKQITNAAIYYTEYYPATIQIEIAKALNPIPANTLQQMQRIKPAGVKLILTYNNSGTPFVFGSDSTGEVPPAFIGLGFGETSVSKDNSAVGGNVTEEIGAGI